MHEQLRERIKKRSAIRETLSIIAMVAVALGIGIVFQRRGMPQKWHAAILGTIVPFGSVMMGVRVAWSRWSFWASLVVCLAFHVAAIWIFFHYVLASVQHFGTLYWFPVAFLEIFVLMIAVKRVEEKLTGKRQYYRWSW
jgi:hypothetical protein